MFNIWIVCYILNQELIYREHTNNSIFTSSQLWVVLPTCLYYYTKTYAKFKYGLAVDDYYSSPSSFIICSIKRLRSSAWRSLRMTKSS